MSRKKNLVVITNSELGTFRTCRKRWWFRYQEQLSAPARISAMSTGSAIHVGLAELRHAQLRYQRAGRPGKFDVGAAVDEARRATLARLRKQVEVALEQDPSFDADDAQKSVEQATYCVELFARRFLEEDAERYDVLAVEMPFRVYVPETRTLFFAGVMDAVLLDRRYGDVVLDEHKSTSQNAYESERKLDLDPQTTGYVWALGRLAASGAFPSQTVGRVVYNVLRKKPPGQPKVNADGMVSRAGVDTTRATYQAALDDQVVRTGKRPTTEQLVLLGTLPDNEDRYAKRIEAFHSEAQRAEWLLELRHDVKLRRAVSRGEVIATRNPEACNPPWMPSCAYRQVCIEDTEARRAATLVRNEHWHPEVEDAISEQEQQT